MLYTPEQYKKLQADAKTVKQRSEVHKKCKVMDATETKAYKLSASSMVSMWLAQKAAYHAANPSLTEAGGQGMRALPVDTCTL